MNKRLKNRTDLTQLEKQASHKFHKISDLNFNKWINGLSAKSKLKVWKHLCIELYEWNFNRSIKMILKYMPEEVTHDVKHEKETWRHYFRFQINIENGLIVVGYKHFISEVLKKEMGGMTDTWCNPFINNEVVDFLIQEKADSEDALCKKLITIYEFLVHNKILK